MGDDSTTRIRIAVLGGRSLPDAEAAEMARRLGEEIVRRDAELWTGGVGGAGEEASAGAAAWLRARGVPPRERIVSAVPRGIRPAHDHGRPVEMGGDWEERRTLLVESVDAAIAVAGGPGTADEIAKARARGICVIPIAFTGGAAREAWSAMQGAAAAGAVDPFAAFGRTPRGGEEISRLAAAAVDFALAGIRPRG